MAAFTVDSKYVGRIRIQLLGFGMVAALFYVAAIWYPILIKPGGIHVFQFVYFFSSFWGQWGPNCTTFLLAGAPGCSVTMSKVVWWPANSCRDIVS